MDNFYLHPINGQYPIVHLENIVEFYNCGSVSRLGGTGISRFVELPRTNDGEGVQLGISGRIKTSVADQLFATECGISAFGTNVYRPTFIHDGIILNDTEIGLVSTRLRRLTDNFNWTNVPWMSKEICSQTEGYQEQMWLYKGHEALRIPYPLYLYLGATGRRSSLTVYSVIDGKLHIQIRNPKRGRLRQYVANPALTISDLDAMDAMYPINGRSYAHQTLEAEANLNTTVLGPSNYRHQTPADNALIKHSLKQGIRNRLALINMQDIGPTMHTYFRATDRIGPSSTLDSAMSSCFLAELPGRQALEPEDERGRGYEAIPVEEIIDWLSLGRFEPTSAVVLTNALLWIGLHKLGVQDPRLIILIERCRNEAERESYPEAPMPQQQ